jgi:hypothetical protein
MPRQYVSQTVERCLANGQVRGTLAIHREAETLNIPVTRPAFYDVMAPGVIAKNQFARRMLNSVA